LKKIILFVLVFGIFVLTSCNDDPDYYYDPKPIVNDTNNDTESSNQETNKESGETKEETKDSSSQNEENKNNNEPGELNDDSWHGALF